MKDCDFSVSTLYIGDMSYRILFPANIIAKFSYIITLPVLNNVKKKYQKRCNKSITTVANARSYLTFYSFLVLMSISMNTVYASSESSALYIF